MKFCKLLFLSGSINEPNLFYIFLYAFQPFQPFILQKQNCNSLTFTNTFENIKEQFKPFFNKKKFLYLRGYYSYVTSFRKSERVQAELRSAFFQIVLFNQRFSSFSYQLSNIYPCAFFSSEMTEDAV